MAARKDNTLDRLRQTRAQIMRLGADAVADGDDLLAAGAAHIAEGIRELMEQVMGRSLLLSTTGSTETTEGASCA